MTATCWPSQDVGDEGVLHDVGGGVGGREGDGDDEVGGDEAEQDQDEELALPPGQQALQHGDRALAVRALARRRGGRSAGRRTASAAPGSAWRSARARRRRGRRCRAGSRGWRSSRPRSGTSPATRGAGGARWAGCAGPAAGRSGCSIPPGASCGGGPTAVGSRRHRLLWPTILSPAEGSLTTASYSQPECRKARYSPRQMATIPTSTSG